MNKQVEAKCHFLGLHNYCLSSTADMCCWAKPVDPATWQCSRAKGTLLIEMVEFPKEAGQYVLSGGVKCPVSLMACLIGPWSHGIYWLTEVGDWEKGSAVALDMNATVDMLSL